MTSSRAIVTVSSAVAAGWPGTGSRAEMSEDGDDESVAAGDWNSGGGGGGGVGDVSIGSAFAPPTRPKAALALDSEASMGEGILPPAALLSSPASIPPFALSPQSDMTTDADVDAAVDAAAGRGGGGNLAVDTPWRFFRCLVRSPRGTQQTTMVRNVM